MTQHIKEEWHRTCLDRFAEPLRLIAEQNRTAARLGHVRQWIVDNMRRT